MTPFEHVAALFSFVYALALTHLLARIAELVVARDRVRLSGERTRPRVLVFAPSPKRSCICGREVRDDACAPRFSEDTECRVIR